MSRLFTTVAAIATAGALAAGCGGSDGGSSGGGGGGGYGGSAPAKTQTSSSSAASTSASSSSSSSASSGTARSAIAIAIAADETNGLAFTKKDLSAKAGKVTIVMTNPGSDSLPHAIAIEGNGVAQQGQVVQPGGASKVSADLRPGTYTFYCPVGSHRSAGMEGTLTVR
jgi:plastocyanin